MTVSGFHAAQLVNAPVEFGRIGALSPPILLEDLGQSPFVVPDYVVPHEIERSTAGSAARHERNELSKTNTPLGQILKHAVEIDQVAVTVDRDSLMAGLHDDMDPTDFLLRFGMYTTFVRPNEALTEYAKEKGTNVVEKGLRDDLIAMLKTGAAIMDGLPEIDQAAFLTKMARNMSPRVIDITEDRQHGSNLSVYLIRNAMINIVGYPDSILDPAVVMGVKILRQVIEDNQSPTQSSGELYLSALLEPEVMLNNPEMFFVLQEHLEKQPKFDQKQADKLSHGMVVALMHKFINQLPSNSYSVGLATMYFHIAVREANISRTAVRRRGASEGGAHNVPITLTHLARTVARANNDRLPLTQRPSQDYQIAFNYLRPMLETDQLWPELDPEVAQTAERAVATVIQANVQS